MTRLSVEFEGPGHGSLTLRIQHQESRCVLFLSYIPCDSISEIVSALLVLVQSGAPSIARLNEEPTEWELGFQPDQGRVTLSLCWIFPRRDGSIERREELRTRGSLDEVVRPFWKALRDLQTRYPPAEYVERWHYPFPARDMERLTELMRGHKA